MSFHEVGRKGGSVHEEMTQHALLHSELTMASPTHPQHPEIPKLNPFTSQLIPLAQSLQHENSTSPALCHHILENHVEASDAEITPPTSSSGFSSQERPIFVDHDRSGPASKIANAKALYGRTSKSSTEEGLKSAVNILTPIEAPKRTSSGQIKRSAIPGVGAPENGHEGKSERSRASSLLSNGSSVTELSQQLRTRLSYAMVKIENGWESNTLEELEILTSQHDSPTLSVAETSIDSKEHTLQSPKTAMTSSLRRRGSKDPPFEGGVAREGNSRIEGVAHRANGNQQRTENRPQRRALAPPADIVPGARRRPHHANAPPSRYRSVISPRATGTKQRTASQNAAMEADAVETLLFMASPGNSSHHPSASGRIASARMSAPTSSQASPLKSEFPSHDDILASPPRRVAFTGVLEMSPRTARRPSQFHDIDRMIDEMDDTSTDSGSECMADTPKQQQTGGDKRSPNLT